MKLRHFAVFGGIFTVIICLLLFLFIVTADDEESGKLPVPTRLAMETAKA